MIQVLELNLVAARRPTQRAVATVERFLNNCNIKKTMSLITEQKFTWGMKQQLVMANCLDNAQEIVKEHKLKRNTESLAVNSAYVFMLFTITQCLCIYVVYHPSVLLLSNCLMSISRDYDEMFLANYYNINL